MPAPHLSRDYITIKTPKLSQRHYKTGQQMNSAGIHGAFLQTLLRLLLPWGGVVSFVWIPEFLAIETSIETEER